MGKVTGVLGSRMVLPAFFSNSFILSVSPGVITVFDILFVRVFSRFYSCRRTASPAGCGTHGSRTFPLSMHAHGTLQVRGCSVQLKRILIYRRLLHIRCSSLLSFVRHEVRSARLERICICQLLKRNCG